SDFAGSGVVHAVGGITALAISIMIGPRIGKCTRQGKPLAMPGHDLLVVLTGCFILAFGWFGFNPGSTLGASGNGNLRIGTIAVHGTNGLWGVISVGLFADGKSNYGGAWNGVDGSVKGLFYGDPGQLVAQLIGCATLLGLVFSFSFVVNWAIDLMMGQRVGAE